MKKSRKYSINHGRDALYHGTRLINRQPPALGRRGKEKKTGRSVFDPYYSRIQELLFLGMSVKEVYEYVEKYFKVYSSYGNFRSYVKRRKLDWFMPMKV